jgi:hypothetical protein
VTAEVVELRCPSPLHPDCKAGNLLAKLRITGERPSYVHPDNLIELPCDKCRSRHRRSDPGVLRVLHRFDLTGEMIETIVVRAR